MANKKTKKEFYGELRELVKDNAELVAFIDHEVELLNKKRTSNGQTATQKANVEVKEKIVNALVEIGRNVTISELQAENEEMAQFSNQKLSALLKQLVDNGEVTKVVDKKKSYFGIAE